MRLVIWCILFLITNSVMGFNCDCELHAYHPLGNQYSGEPKVLKKFEIEAFGSYSKKNIESCRKLCTDEFENQINPKKLTRILSEYSSQLIADGLIGYSCTSLTLLKYPLRVKAYLGEKSIGNSSDFIHVIYYDHKCF